MEQFYLEQDIHVCCITATSFPEGIMDAHEQLHALIPFSKERRYFGISRPDHQGTIIYKAAAEVLQPDEKEPAGCEPFVIPGGRYISSTIINYPGHLEAISKTFRELLSVPGIDPNGYCVEWYLGEKDMRCMVRLSNE